MLTRKNFFLLGLAAIIGVSVWLYFTYLGVKRTQDALVEQASLIRPPRAPTAVPPRQAENKAILPTTARLQAEAVRLQEELVQENKLLAEKSLALESLRARQNEENQTPTVDTFATDLRDRRFELNQFARDLNTNARLRDEVNRQADQLLREQSSQVQLARSQIDNTIRQQEVVVRQIESELSYWKENFNDLTLQQRKVAELRESLNTAKERLEIMQNEKLLLSAQALQNTQTVQTAKSQALADLDDEREGLSEEVTLLRAEIRRLQEQVYQSSNQSLLLQREIQRHEKAIRDQQQKIQKLETSLLKTNAELKNLE